MLVLDQLVVIHPGLAVLVFSPMKVNTSYPGSCKPIARHLNATMLFGETWHMPH